MIECKGIWLPDGEDHLVEMISQSQIVNGRGTYQYPKLSRALSFVSTRARAIDVGAHVGTWSMHLADFFAHTECFEPVPSHRECWRRNMEGRENGAVLHDVALGAEPGRARIVQTPGSSGHTYVSGSPTDAVTCEVEMRTLDSYDFQSVGLIKIDVEGYEHFVIEGAVDTIKRERPIMVVEQKQRLDRVSAAARGKVPWRDQMAGRYGLEDTQAITLLKSMGLEILDLMNGDYIMGWT